MENLHYHSWKEDIILPRSLRHLNDRHPFIDHAAQRFLTEDPDTVLGYFISATDTEGVFHTCWLNCRIYDIPTIRRLVIDYENKHYTQREGRLKLQPLTMGDEIEVVGRGCDCRVHIGLRIISALGKVEEHVLSYMQAVTPPLIDIDKILRSLK